MPAMGGSASAGFLFNLFIWDIVKVCAYKYMYVCMYLRTCAFIRTPPPLVA